jgi:dTDP-4-amino-4,6-dideoxygalactose transaminase
VTYCNAYPHLIDTDLTTLGVDVEKLHDYLRKFTMQESGLCVNKKTGRVIRALIPVHLFGHVVGMNDLIELAKDYKIAIIEDAAEALGSFYKGKHAGTIGVLGTLSFNGNKIITTGGGGALMTKDDKLANLARHLSTTAKLPHKWEFRHNLVGFNYRMPNLNAAVGCAQLEELPKKISQKRVLFKKYREAFALVNGVELFQEPEHSVSNYWLQTLILDESQSKWKDAILELTNLNHINTRPAWEPLHLQAPYADSESMNLENVNLLRERIINIPSSPKLADE